MIETLPINESDDRGEWIAVPEHNVTYSSLVGLTISGLSDVAVSNFTIESSYIKLHCSNVVNSTRERNLTMISNATLPIAWSGGWYSTFPDRSGTVFWSNTTACRGGSSEPRLIAFDVWDDLNRTLSQCTAWTTYVEMAVLCQGQECAATKMRHSTRDHRSNATTFPDEPYSVGSCNQWAYFLVITSRPS